MGFIISTKSHTYRIEDTNDETIKLITGGKFRENEIKVFSDMHDIQETLNFVAYFTKNDCNKGFTGKVILGEIQSVNQLPCIQVVRPNVQSSERVMNAGQFFVMDNNRRDVADILRQNYEDLNAKICSLMHDASDMQRIYITDSIMDDNTSQCTVICVIDEETDALWLNIQNIILSKLDDNCLCSNIMFVEQRQMHTIEQNYSRNKTRLKESNEHNTHTSNSRTTIHSLIQPVFNLC